MRLARGLGAVLSALALHDSFLYRLSCNIREERSDSVCGFDRKITSVDDMLEHQPARNVEEQRC